MGRLGPTVLWPGEGDIQVDIWFVHGLRGDSLDTWTKGNICWPRDLLKEDLKNSRIITWGYDSSILKPIKVASQASIFSHAENLLNDVCRMRLPASEAEKIRPIIFVGHSLGGLVIKEALLRSAEYYHARQDKNRGAVYESCKGVVFLGTPNRGSSKTEIATLVSRIAEVALHRPNDKLLGVLKEDSDVLEWQRRSFASISAAIPLTCVSEELPTRLGLIVPERSASIDGANVETSSIHADHMDMCKFADASDVGYQRVSLHIMSFVSKITEADHEVHMRDINGLMESLKFEEIYDRENHIVDRHYTTFTWILDDSSSTTGKDSSPRQHTYAEASIFRRWLTSEDPIFWLSGKAGSGKSTLMKYLHDHPSLKQYLQEWAHEDQIVIAAFYFYEDSPSELQRSREGLFRSILYQVMQQRPELQQTILSPFINEYRQCRRNIEWRSQQLQHAFKALLRLASKSLRICLLVDGLDEYRTLDQRGRLQDTGYQLSDVGDAAAGASARASRIANSHREIAQIFSEVAKIRYVKLCLSSRPLNIFKETFSTFPGFQLEDLTRQDIHDYVQSKVFSHPRVSILSQGDRVIVDELVHEIFQKACGVFLWVTLVVDRLLTGLSNRDRLSRLQEKVRVTPSRLRGNNGLFMQMLRDIDPEDRNDGLRLFDLVLESSTPLTALTLAFAEDPDFHGISRPVHIMTDDEILSETQNMEARLKGYCAGLLETRPQQGDILPRGHISTFPLVSRPQQGNILPRGHISTFPLVQFIHRSAKEFMGDSNVRLLLGSTGKSQPLELTTSLLSSSILRIKRIGITPDHKDLWGAISEAFRCLKQLEMQSGSHSCKWLEIIDKAADSLWTRNPSLIYEPREISDLAGLSGWERKVEEPGHANKVIRKRGSHWANCKTKDSTDQPWSLTWESNLLTLAIEADLTLFVEAKIHDCMTDTAKIGRPLLNYTIVPDRSLGWFWQGDSQSSPQMTKTLLRAGGVPNEVFPGDYTERYGPNILSVWQLSLLQAVQGPSSYVRIHDTDTWQKWSENAKLLIQYGALPNAAFHFHITLSHNGAVLFEGKLCSPLLVCTLLDQHCLYDEQHSLVNLLLSKGAHLLYGEKAFIKGNLKVRDREFASRLPGVYQVKEAFG